ncbi:murein hydrolase activator EnvC family protein [Halovulum sp. GXIMD14793]
MRVLAALWLLLVPAMAQADEISQAAETLSIADALLKSAEGAEDRGLALSEAIRAYEGAIASLYNAAQTTAAEERRLSRALDAQRRDQARLLSGLMRLSTVAEPMLALGDDPVALSHGAALMDRVQQSGTAKILDLREDLGLLERLQDLQNRQRADLARAREALLAARDDLSADSATLPDAEADAANLVALAIALEGLPDASSAAPAPETRRPAPVRATVLKPFGDRPGTSLAATAGAMVATPEAASIRFAGQMDGYGRVVILEPAPGRLYILAGLDRLLVNSGMNVAKGRGLGFLPGQPDLHKEFLAGNSEETGTPATETLYIEVRVDGTPVDPAQWFAFEN